jgi:hypothetical protein
MNDSGTVCAVLHPVVTPKFLLIKIPGIFGVDQSKFFEVKMAGGQG